MTEDPFDPLRAAGTLFYDVDWRRAGVDPTLADFSLATRPVPPGWHRSDNDEWLFYRPLDIDLPAQGWKVHVSACLDNADKVLDVVWGLCIELNLPFKYLRSPRALLRRNAKEAARGHSGKLVTIYPSDVAAMEATCAELDDRLRGERGPYILSDLRWGDGPVFVRYGGFLDRWCRSATGDMVPAIEDDTGALVPDDRPPAFTVPPWVPLPDCLAPHLAARNAVTVADLPYRVESALLFSNGGGVYTGRDLRTGERVVLKEARPHAGLSADGADAVARLRGEHEVLRRLAGLPGVPGVRELVDVGDHLFLVMDHVDGEPLHRHIVRRNPGLGQATDPVEAAEYTRWAIEACAAVERIVDGVHARGLVYADLHPRNVLVAEDGRVAALVDYEVAFDVGAPRRQQLAVPGFRAPPGRTGTAIDDYALACLRLAMFMPVTPLFELCPQKAAQVADAIAAEFPVPPGWLADAVRTITGDGRDGPAGPVPGWRAAEPGAWPATRDALVRAIVASATPERDDRLFPGDSAQFRTGGLNIAHGAAGVLYALSTAGAGRFEEYERWLVDHATRPVEDPRLGLYDGYHGVAHVLDHLGHRERALEVVELCLAEPWEESGHDLRGGLAGIGLNLAHLADATDEAALRASAVRAAEILADRLALPDDPATVSGGGHPYAGLLRGWAGPAQLFLRLHDAGGDRSYLDLAAAALRRDLRRCVRREDDGGVMHVNEGWRSMPYLATGSVGIGLVLDEYLAREHDAELAAASAAIHGAACARFYVEPGLFDGRAGMVAYLAARRHAGDDVQEHLRRQVDLLRWHAIGYGGGIAFPGQHLVHLSMDLATGTAGVLLALGAAFHDRPVHLPGLAARQRATQLST